MELPTYTNIWKIEKRLYKLYDFRLPMPLPVGQVAAFLAIAVPYTLLLTMIGMPFSHTWVWLYVLPPALLAWLVTRPVLEGKRLPELVLSQLRYLSEPRTWCRMAPLTERDEIVIVAKVWRAPARARVPAEIPAVVRPAADTKPVSGPTDAPAATDTPAVSAVPAISETPEPMSDGVPDLVPERVRVRSRASSAPEPRPVRPVVTITTDGPAARSLHVVERALRAPGNQADVRRERVVIIPGGHRPGKPDPVQRDQARARLPLAGAARIVVLGCTAGAGQTLTTLLAGQMLASLRAEPVAVLDLRPGPGSLTERARAIPRLLPGLRPDQGADGASSPEFRRERGLQVVTAERRDDQGADVGTVIDAVVARYALTLADPAAGHVPRALHVADQLVLVAPASADAAHSLAMTLEWLEAHNHQPLARNAVIVLNGVSAQTAEHADAAARVATGRARAVVRVPWDDQVASGGPIGTAAVHAYTALAGLIVSGLADPAMARTGSR